MILFPPQHSEFGAYGAHMAPNGSLVEFWDGPTELGSAARMWLAAFFPKQLEPPGMARDELISFVYVLLSREPLADDNLALNDAGPAVAFASGSYPATRIELPQLPARLLYEAAAKFALGDR